MNQLAKIGSNVNFKLLDGSHITGDVLYMPNGFGDSWVIQSYYEGKKDLVVYVQQFQFMSVCPEIKEESK